MPMLEVPEAMVDKILAVNVKSIYLAALHVVPVFRRQGKAASSSTPPRRRGSGRARALPSITPRKAPRSS